VADFCEQGWRLLSRRHPQLLPGLSQSGIPEAAGIPRLKATLRKLQIERVERVRSIGNLITATLS
jgi:hypothetical protein